MSVMSGHSSLMNTSYSANTLEVNFNIIEAFLEMYLIYKFSSINISISRSSSEHFYIKVTYSIPSLFSLDWKSPGTIIVGMMKPSLSFAY